MSPERLEQFKELYNEFNERCEVISTKLSEINKDFYHTETYFIEDDEVVGTGSYLPWGECRYEFVEARFPVSLLTATDEEIDAYVRKELNIIEKMVEERKKREEAARRESDLQKLAELKKKYPDA